MLGREETEILELGNSKEVYSILKMGTEKRSKFLTHIIKVRLTWSECMYNMNLYFF